MSWVSELLDAFPEPDSWVFGADPFPGAPPLQKPLRPDTNTSAATQRRGKFGVVSPSTRPRIKVYLRCDTANHDTYDYKKRLASISRMFRALELEARSGPRLEPLMLNIHE
eukprot:Blabericola_migrator_1__6273@NODE_3166_length_1985_cov_51_137122_g1983_i0_p2_GENE_NODE_3166_length_1985_cov_51_137122_g1983_i0NODE_3166_length_1985_cov_51_137122_g1983_i0_p2_ORF_typecomplete_len111_score8_54_NODE_3166_length_1985_cov_51_137122_g1983_i010891421